MNVTNSIRALGIGLAAMFAVSVPTAHADVPGYRSAVMADGPIAYWHLDEALGTTATDFAGSNYDGTFAGSAALLQSPPFGVGANTAVRLGIDGTMTAMVPGTMRTVELWVRPTTRAQQTFVRFGDPAAGGWALSLSGLHAAPNAKRKMAFTSHGQTTNSKVRLAANSWSHVEVSWASGSTLKFAINGGATTKVTHPTLLPDADPTLRPLVLGPAAGANGTSFDEVALYPSNINGQAHFNATGLPVLTSSPTLTPLAGVQVGDTLTFTPGTWGAGTSVVDTWQRCDSIGACQTIAGATTTYTLQPADAGFTIQVEETGTNATGSATVYTDATDTVANADGTLPNPLPVLPPGSDPTVPPQESQDAIAGQTSTPATPAESSAPAASDPAPAPTASTPQACVPRLRAVYARTIRVRRVGKVRARLATRTRTATVRARRRTIKRVTWTLDGRRVKVAKRAPYTLKLRKALTVKRHVLRARVVPRKGKVRTIKLTVTVSC